MAAANRVQSERHNVLRGWRVSGVASGWHYGGAFGRARIPVRDQKLGASPQRAAPVRRHSARDRVHRYTRRALLQSDSVHFVHVGVCVSHRQRKQRVAHVPAAAALTFHPLCVSSSITCYSHGGARDSRPEPGAPASGFAGGSKERHISI